MANQRRLIHFKGEVQGVGFRYTARHLAGANNLTGYVRNLPNGQVEVLAEGSPADLDAFINDLRGRLGSYIRDVTEQTSEPTGEFFNFDVRF